MTPSDYIKRDLQNIFSSYPEELVTVYRDGVALCAVSVIPNGNWRLENRERNADFCEFRIMTSTTYVPQIHDLIQWTSYDWEVSNIRNSRYCQVLECWSKARAKR